MKSPAQSLSPFDAITITIGVVVGAGIFKTPSVVAAQAGSVPVVLLLWLLGGFISLLGALCYAELATSYPDTGGDYHFIRRAYGTKSAFLFAWARMTVIQTGSIAMLAFIIGDYASELFRLGSMSSSWYAAGVLVLVTGINVSGVRQSSGLQNVLTTAIILGLSAVVLAGLGVHGPAVESGTDPLPVPGKAMIFVLLTYGGWNEAAYLSAEIRHVERTMTPVLLISIGIITVLYLGANVVYLRGLGLAATARSETVAADLMRAVMGEPGAKMISLLVVAAALGALNGVIMTGARTNYALGRDFRRLAFLGRWRERTNAPVNALLVQGCIGLALVGMGSATRSGFSTMVEYTAPVFWFFFLLAGASLFILRRKEPARIRPFSVPFYPFVPLAFCGFCIYMFCSSLLHAGIGAATGVGVLLAGIPVLWLSCKIAKENNHENETGH